MNPSLKYLFMLLTIINNQVRSDDFVYQYFLQKNVSRVNLFSCGKIENDFSFVKKMNSLGISVAVNHPNSKLYNVSKQIFKRDYWPFGLFLDTRCQPPEVNEKIITQTSNYRFYEGIHVWLLLASNLDEISLTLNDTSYSLLTDFVIGIPTEIGYNLYDVYNPCKIRGGKLNITSLGTWIINEGLNITIEQSKFVRRSNLHGMAVKVAAVIKYRPPGMTIEDHLRDYTEKSKDPVTKYGFAILEQIADQYNFTMEMLAVDEWIATINNTEVGMMPTLYRGEADIGATSATATLRYGAKPYGRMVGPGYPFRTFFLFRSNIPTLKWLELITPLAMDSWYAVVTTAIISVTIVTVMQVTEYRGGWLAESGHVIFAMIGIFCQQGLVFVPNRLAGRVAFFFLLIMGVLLFNYYGASVVSARLNEPPDKMNDSLYSLAKTKVPLSSEAFRNVDDFIKARSANEWEVNYFNEKVWSKLSSVSRFTPPETSLEKVISGDYAYHTTPEVAYPYVEAHWDEKAICDITEIHVITPRTLSFWERVDSPFTEIMRVGLFKIANTGLRMRTIKRWKPRIPYCSEESRSLQSLTILEIAPALMLILIGVAVAVVTYLIERIVYRFLSADAKAKTQQETARVGGKIKFAKSKEKM